MYTLSHYFQKVPLFWSKLLAIPWIFPVFQKVANSLLSFRALRCESMILLGAGKSFQKENRGEWNENWDLRLRLIYKFSGLLNLIFRVGVQPVRVASNRLRSHSMFSVLRSRKTNFQVISRFDPSFITLCDRSQTIITKLRWSKEHKKGWRNSNH